MREASGTWWSSAVEHPAVMAPAQQLRRQGWELTVVPVDGTGRVSVQSVADALRAIRRWFR